MMTLPLEQEQCLQRHSQHISRRMAPDGVFIYLSGAKLLDDEDLERYGRACDDLQKNHALLNIVARHGGRGFEAFVDALETTQQFGIVERLRMTLKEKYNNENVGVDEDVVVVGGGGGSLHRNMNGGGAGGSGGGAGGGLYTSYRGSYNTSATAGGYGSQHPMIPMRPVASRSPAFSRSRSVPSAMTPPLSEAELDDHLRRLKELLNRISTSHSDRYCRMEAAHLMGELDQAGDAMVDRVRQLSEENADKERELRSAKFMVRGMETEINKLKMRVPSLGASAPNSDGGHVGSASDQAGKPKSKLCAIL